MFTKHATILLLIVFLCNNLLPVESGAALQRIKDSLNNIKKYLRGENEEVNENDAVSNLDGNVATKTSTAYPRIDIRGHEDFDVETTTNIFISSRRLIDVPCPRGTKLDITYNCRPI